MSATLRFEVILPDVSFQLVHIPIIPFLESPLTAQLFRSDREKENCSGVTQSNRCSSSKMKNNFGYLTMSKTRKLVPLLESDVSLPTCPVVGIWVSNLTDQDSGTPVNYLSHPFVWAACLRFISLEKLTDKAFIIGETFLLVPIAHISLLRFISLHRVSV